jgi:hypothetical protein
MWSGAIWWMASRHLGPTSMKGGTLYFASDRCMLAASDQSIEAQVRMHQQARDRVSHWRLVGADNRLYTTFTSHIPSSDRLVAYLGASTCEGATSGRSTARLNAPNPNSVSCVWRRARKDRCDSRTTPRPPTANDRQVSAADSRLANGTQNSGRRRPDSSRRCRATMTMLPRSRAARSLPRLCAPVTEHRGTS